MFLAFENFSSVPRILAGGFWHLRFFLRCVVYWRDLKLWMFFGMRKNLMEKIMRWKERKDVAKLRQIKMAGTKNPGDT